MNQSQGNQKQEQPQAPGEITINVEAQTNSNINKFSLIIDPIAPFIVFQKFVHDLLSGEIEDFQRLKYILDGHLINEIEKKTLQELGFYNNCILNINVCPGRNCQKFTFRIITKQSIFNFDLECPSDIECQHLEFLIKERIFELSGLQAKKDYIDRLIFQSRSQFTPHVESDLYSQMAGKIIIEVILKEIDKVKS